MAGYAEHSTVRPLIHDATAIARSFGRERAHPVELLHACANRRTPIGEALAADRLSEDEIVRWRRDHGMDMPPILDLTPTEPDDSARAVLRRVIDIGWMLSKDTTDARVAGVLLDDPSDPEIIDLLARTGKVRRKTLRFLRKLGAPEATRRPDRSGEWPRPYRSIAGWRLVDGSVVLVPNTDRPTGGGFRSEIPALAVVVANGAEPSEVGASVLATFDRCGPDPDAGQGPPYWELFGHATRGRFNRRARYVAGTEFDAALAFDGSVHSGADRFELVHWLTPIRAPIDRPSHIGAALTAALDASRG